MAKIGEIMQSLMMSNPKRASWFLAKMPEDFWFKMGQKKALRLFKEASRRVPAYQDFLKRHNVNPEAIKDIKDFERLPIIDKKSYLDLYPLEKLCWDGDLAQAYMVATSSGSTGKPYFWPRLAELDKTIPQVMELLYREFFDIEKKKTLLLITLALGTWAAGELAAESSRIVSRKSNLPLTVITPGLNLEETLKIIKEIGNKYEQIILIGYPTFLRDIIKEGIARDINWADLNIKILGGGERMSEEWRDYIKEKIGAGEYVKAIINLFACADTGIIGHETPLSILINKLAQKDLRLCEAVFGFSQVPSLNQFNPLGSYVEKIDNEIVLTRNSGAPLIRYNISDRGGVISFEEMMAKIKEAGYDLEKLFEEKSLDFRRTWKLPFLYVFGRSDAVSLYALNIYVDNIKSALENPEIINTNTHKFKMKVVVNEAQEQKLILSIQLAKGITLDGDLRRKYFDVIVKTLREKNSEYNRLHGEKGEKVLPQVNLLPHDSEIFISEDVKFKYIDY